MKKKSSIFFSALIFAASNLIPHDASSQLVRLNTGFDNYTGSAATVPSGWRISWNSTSSPSYYFSAGNFGTAIPSYKFGITQDTIVSPHFLSGDTLRFWCKGQVPFSAQNVLAVFISSDSVSWNQIQNIDSLPVNGAALSFPLPCSAHYLMFIYFKVNGNLAFDDVKVTMTNYFPIAGIAMFLNIPCAGDSACFGDASTMMGCDSIIAWQWNFGDSTPNDTSENPCHVYLIPGNFIIYLHVTASNGNTDSTILIITIAPLPVTQFSASNTNGTFVNFTDLSTITSGNIVSWYWDFGDLNFSAQQNPLHFYSSVGTYFVCLNAVSNSGCTNSYCDSVHVIDAGIEDYNSSSGISFGPNPAGSTLYITSNKPHAIGPIEIFDVLGQSVLRQKPAAGSRQQILDVSKLNRGIYFLNVKTELTRASFKLIIEK